MAAKFAVTQAIMLLFLVSAGHSLTLDAIRGMMNELIESGAMEKKEVTLREHLDGLEMPDPLNRYLRTNPNVFCDECPTPSFPNNDTKCRSDRWKPEYVKQVDGCECLAGYKCCKDKCQAVDVKSCWENGQKGLLHGILEKDCCDCPVVKCINCESVIPEDQLCPRGEGARPSDCYKYTKHFSHASDDGCWLSHCAVKSSDAFNSTCLPDCQSDKMVTTHCQFPQNDCQNDKVLADCPNKDIEKATKELTKPQVCYHPAVESDDDPSGFYYDGDQKKCEKCKKWTYAEKSCSKKNKDAKNEDCHEYGEHLLNKKCFSKVITKDDCGCDLAQCILTSQRDPEVFDPEDGCPKSHVKIAGVSLCLKRRDLCKKCPPFTPIDPNNCKNGKIVTVKDCNGCDVSKCEKPAIPLDGCPCKIFIFDSDSKTLKCYCVPTGYRKGADGYFYKYHKEGKNWNDAQNICQGDGGNLAIIFNQHTRDVVRGFMSDGWIGLTDKWQEGKWQTPIRGDPPYTSWIKGEPNDHSTGEDCAIQHANKLWNDLPCSHVTSFICQWTWNAGI